MSTTQTTKPEERGAPEGKRDGERAARHPAPPALAGRLERLRDRIRLDLHLAKMEARERWHRVEPQIFHAEKLASTVMKISARALGQIAAEVRRFQDHLRQHRQRA